MIRAMSSSSWRAVRGFGRRFGIVLGALVIFPFPLGTIPWTEGLARILTAPLEWLAGWVQGAWLGLPPVPPATGSGDTSYDYSFSLVIAALAVLGAVVWTALDRRRERYPRLAAAVLLGLRYSLALTMILYGLTKVFKVQMPDLRPGDLATPLGDLTPMGLAWAFMGYSTAYSVFAGLAEVAAGVLLLGRRTAVLGALVVVAVMTNVVMMNLCFDIPVKLYATQLLVTALVILAPSLRRLLGAALGRAVPELPPPPRWSPRWERARWIAKLVVLTAIPGMVAREWPLVDIRNGRVHELYGNWLVDDFALDGTVRPPLTTDPARWSRLDVNGRGLWMVSMQGARAPADLTVDAAHATLAVTPYADPNAAPDPREVTETWRYARPTPDTLVLDGTHAGHALHVALHRAPPWRLTARPFRWINPFPDRARDRRTR
jgi:hypothetical protein